MHAGTRGHREENGRRTTAASKNAAQRAGNEGYDQESRGVSTPLIRDLRHVKCGSTACVGDTFHATFSLRPTFPSHL